MRDLVVKDNALINASYNLDLVEQRLILLAIVEARESGKGINANDPLEVHAESYINQFNVARQTAYQALKDACKDLFARQFSYQEINKRGNVENVLSRWVSEIRYIDDEATVKLIFAPAIVPLITRLEVQTDITVKYEQHKKGRNISGFSFSFKQKKGVTANANSKSSNTLDLFSKMTDAQRHLFANKLSELADMSKYSQGTESYAQFAIRIAEMLQNQEKFEELLPYLKKVGFNAK